MTKEQILEILKSNRELITQGQIDIFRSAMSALNNIEYIDVEYVENLLTILADETEGIETMSELEDYIVYQIDKSISIEALVNMSPIILKKAKEWLFTLYAVFFARNADFHYFRIAYSKLSLERKDKMLEIFDYLKSRSIIEDSATIEQSIHSGIEYIIAE